MRLSEIKIMIIEDSLVDLKAIKFGLLKLERNNGSDKLDANNINTRRIQENENFQNVVSKIKEYNPHVIFIDLHLINDVQDGMGIIRTLMADDSFLRYLPKYIITGAVDTQNNTQYLDVFQMAFPIQKPTYDNYTGDDEQDIEGLGEKYYKVFGPQLKLQNILPLLSSMYKQLQEKFDLSMALEVLNYKLDEAQINQESTLQYLKLQEKILNKIDINIDNIQERTHLIEVITKATAKALPKITDKNKAEKLIKLWSEDDEFEKIMGEDFPELPSGLYDMLNNIWESLKDNAKEDIGKTLYEAGKEYIQNQAGIEDGDDKLQALMKYSAFFTEKIYTVVK